MAGYHGGLFSHPVTQTGFPWSKKVFIKTFGCQMNEYDSAKMLDVLGASEGAVRTDTPEDADIILFNTCSVREKSPEKCFPTWAACASSSCNALI